MKKISFLEASSKSRMTASQMQKVTGGGTCGFIVYQDGGDPIIVCGVSKEQANTGRDFYDRKGDSSNWCCDSCGGSTYC